jgi:hypothetical protein
MGTIKLPKTLVVLATTAVLSILGAASAAASDRGDPRDRGGYVIPCSLVGVNPVYHPEVFDNPASARAIYGFVRSRDGTWQVEKNCVRGPYHSG